MDADLVARIAAAGFYGDPVATWIFPDDAARLGQLESMFGGLVRDFLTAGEVGMVDDACITLWRAPDYDHGASDDGDEGDLPFPADVVERIEIINGLMSAAHPHDHHWYLNFISTRPESQGQGLGTRALQPVLAICDADAVPAYLESSNPRNMTLYRRHGFEQTGEIPLPDGPSLYPMWRNPSG